MVPSFFAFAMSSLHAGWDKTPAALAGGHVPVPSLDDAASEAASDLAYYVGRVQPVRSH